MTVTWTSSFDPYGVEVFAEPIERHLVLGEDGPERIGSDGESRWTGILDTPVLRATTSWGADRTRSSHAGERRGPRACPCRRDSYCSAPGLQHRRVWFAAAIPQYPSMERVFIPGNEIMIVFSAARVRHMGYDDPRFVA